MKQPDIESRIKVIFMIDIVLRTPESDSSTPTHIAPPTVALSRTYVNVLCAHAQSCREPRSKSTRACHVEQ